jgi:hypothetical protein
LLPLAATHPYEGIGLSLVGFFNFLEKSMARLKMMALIDSLAGTRLSEGADTSKNKRNRRSRLDQHIEAIHQFLFEKTKSTRPHVYSLRKLAALIAKKDGKTIHHTTLLRYLKNKGLGEIFNG